MLVTRQALIASKLGSYKTPRIPVGASLLAINLQALRSTDSPQTRIASKLVPTKTPRTPVGASLLPNSPATS